MHAFLCLLKILNVCLSQSKRRTIRNSNPGRVGFANPLSACLAIHLWRTRIPCTIPKVWLWYLLPPKGWMRMTQWTSWVECRRRLRTVTIVQQRRRCFKSIVNASIHRIYVGLYILYPSASLSMWLAGWLLQFLVNGSGKLTATNVREPVNHARIQGNFQFIVSYQWELRSSLVCGKDYEN